MTKTKIEMLICMTLSLNSAGVQAQKGVEHFNISLFCNTDSLKGANLSILTNAIKKDMQGVQISALNNFATKGNGSQIGMLSNASTSTFKGIQLAGISNVSMGMKRGIQLAGAANICSSSMRGIQTAVYNYADTLNGSQIGLFNACISHPRGVQIGIINYSRDTVAHKIGLVNVNPKTRIDLLSYIGTSTKLNMALRFRNRSTYNIIGIGTHYMGLDSKFSGALFYRIGQYFQLNPKFSLSGDLGYYHVETFEEHSSEKPKRLFSLQARLNADYQLGHYSSLFASVGYGDTRYYHHAQHYRNRLLLEGGIAFRLVRNGALENQKKEEKANIIESLTLGNKQADQYLPATDSLMQVYAANDPSRQKKHPWKAAQIGRAHV